MSDRSFCSWWTVVRVGILLAAGGGVAGCGGNATSDAAPNPDAGRFDGAVSDTDAADSDRDASFDGPSDGRAEADAEADVDGVHLPATCGELLAAFGPAPLDNDDAIWVWTDSSAPNVLLTAYAAGRYLQSPSGCPFVSVRGDVLTIEGGCSTGSTTYAGTISGHLTPRALWLGYAGFPAIPTPLADVTYQRWTVTEEGSCGGGFSGRPYTTSRTLEGTVTFADTSNGGVNFDVDLRMAIHRFGTYYCIQGIETLGLCYHGTVMETDSDYDGYPDKADWNGTGSSGSSRFGGVVDVSTSSELIDRNVCSSEAASGSTTISAGATTVEFRYDGATDCSPSSTVTWLRNGVVQGELSEIRQ